jgi:hypothetical protein
MCFFCACRLHTVLNAVGNVLQKNCSLAPTIALEILHDRLLMTMTYPDCRLNNVIQVDIRERYFWNKLEILPLRRIMLRFQLYR